MLTPKGNISIKVAPGRSFKRWLRIEKVARLELLCIPEIEIAAHVGVTTQGLQAIKRTPEYKAKRLELATGVLTTQDKEMRESEESLRAELRAMVPQSLGVYKETLHAGLSPLATVAQRRMALQVSQDVMDREGTIAKVSRTQVTQEIVPVFDASLASDLLAALQAGNNARQQGDASIHNVFVKAAGLSQEQTATLHENLRLEDFNAPPQ